MLCLLALLLTSVARAADPPPTPAEKSARLATLQAEFRDEVAKNGFDSDRAKQLRDAIAALESIEAVAPDGSAGSAPATPASGGTEGPSTPPGEHLVPGIETVSDYNSDASVGNPCGAYAVTAILRSFGDQTPYQTVFNSIVPISAGTSPHDIKSFLMDHGHRVNDRNNGSLEDLASGVDRGERMMLLLNVKGDGSFSGLHWATIKGYRIRDGKRYWILEDTYYGAGKELTDEELARAWKEPVVSSAFGYNNYYMTVGAEGPSVWDRVSNAFYGMNDRTPAEVVTSGIRDVTRGYESTFGSGYTVGQRVGGFFHMVGGGVVKVVFGGICGAVAIGGHYVEQAGDSMMAWGSDKWNNGGFFGKIAGAGACILGGLVKGVGWVIGTAGEIACGICGAVGDLVGGIGDAIGGAADAVGDFIGGLW